MLMYSPKGGFHHFPEGQVEDAKKDGWIDGQPIWDAAVKAKRKDTAKADTIVLANPVEVDTIPVQSEVKRSPGRPKRPSILNDEE